MFLNNALGFLARRLPGTVTGLVLIAMAGCGTSTGSTINDILDAQIRSHNNGALPSETARIVLVNETQDTIEFDLLIDSVATTITCTATDKRCEFDPLICPSNIEVVEERHLNDLGAFVGGRDCESTLVFTFTEDETKPQVL